NRSSGRTPKAGFACADPPSPRNRSGRNKPTPAGVRRGRPVTSRGGEHGTTHGNPLSSVLVLGIPATSFGDDDHGRGPRLKADPFVFVGRAGDCGAGFAAGSNIVTAAWLGGMGLPDNAGQN